MSIKYLARNIFMEKEMITNEICVFTNFCVNSHGSML